MYLRVLEVYEKFKPQELSDTKVMYLHSHGPGFIHTKGVVHKMEDLKGLKIRSHGPTAETLKCLGGTPVALPMPELYQALQKGVVQGGICPMEGMKGFRISGNNFENMNESLSAVYYDSCTL